MMDKHNSPYYLWCQKVLPLVYDDSLSYYETICKLINVVNEVIEKIQENDETIFKYVDDAILSVEKRCKDYSDNKINKLLSQVIAITNAIYSYINGEDMLIKNKYDKELNSIWLYLKNIPVDGSGFVINPITLKVDSIQNTFNSMYEVIRYYGLTCYEYDTLNLTCDQYDNYNLTCLQYELYGKIKLLQDWLKRYLYMPHPVTGVYEDVRNVVSYLISLHKINCLTCSEYDSLEKTCDEYSNYNMTSYQYDWESKTIMV